MTNGAKLQNPPPISLPAWVYFCYYLGPCFQVNCLQGLSLEGEEDVN